MYFSSLLLLGTQPFSWFMNKFTHATLYDHFIKSLTVGWGSTSKAMYYSTASLPKLGSSYLSYNVFKMKLFW